MCPMQLLLTDTIPFLMMSKKKYTLEIYLEGTSFLEYPNGDL